MEQALEKHTITNVTALERPTVDGKFLRVGNSRFWVRGVSYGTFLVDENGHELLTPETVERDFEQIAANGFNVVRVHTCPPLWLLDAAMRHGLRIMIGLNWGERMSFVDESHRQNEIEERIRKWVRSCSGHPAVFCYCVGNEISSSMARWAGRRRVEGFVRRLFHVAKEEDPGCLVTYVNYPSTEYLKLPFLDFVCFNVYLESQQAFCNYIARLHNLTDDRPLLISEIGLDSLRNGEEGQAETLTQQIQTIFQRGCCGVVVFAWTDEWYHGKYVVEDWKFGLTTRDRTPKPALRAVKRAFLQSPFPSEATDWPRISVVVCSYNGASTIRDTLESLQKLDYPDFEVIVVNDGSTDATKAIVSEYPVTAINTENRGLSEARNAGIQASTGDIVAFIDDDAYPDVYWLRFLALSLMDARLAGTGGPNLSPLGDGWMAEAISNAPGPNPVLISDTIAEHLPGCNMAFRKSVLETIGGFDSRFRVAGDDVDLCWRIRDRGEVIGYTPAAVVWHHRRKSIRKYWKQQFGYGRAEALLENKWPGKYNTFGQLKWLGRIYGRGIATDISSLGGRVYQGVWGTAPFQRLYGSSSGQWSVTLMPEWYLIIALLSFMLALTIGWGPVIIPGTILAVTIALPVIQAIMNASRSKMPSSYTRSQVLRSKAIIIMLHSLQPLARLVGRFQGGLTPWRHHGGRIKLSLIPLKLKMWRDRWEAPEATLCSLQSQLQTSGASVRTGGDYDSWDIEIRGGLFGSSRLLLALEDHPPVKQLVRYRITPKYSALAPLFSAPFVGISIAASLSGAWIQSFISAVIVCMIIASAVVDTAFANGTFHDLLKRNGAG